MSDFAVAPDILPAGDAIHAGFWRRAAAWLLDALILGGVLSQIDALLFIAGGLFGLNAVARVASIGLVTFLIPGLYFALTESSRWQATPGKLALRLKVVDMCGQRIGLGRAAGRWLGKMASTLTLGAGFMMAGWTRRRQALHDRLAGTLVVFDTVRPNRPLPERRPVMPVHGWVILVGLPAFFLVGVGVGGIVAAIALPQYQAHQTKISQARMAGIVDAAKALENEIDRRGCHQPLPSDQRQIADPWVTAIEVQGVPDSGACQIVLTLDQALTPIETPHPWTIRLTRAADGGWRCASTLPEPYLPQTCLPVARPACPPDGDDARESADMPLVSLSEVSIFQ